MELKRKVAMAAVTLTAAFAAGHLMQNGFGGATQTAALQTEKPQAIMPLAAGVGTGPTVAMPSPAAPALPETAFGPTPPQEMPSEAAQHSAPARPEANAKDLDTDMAAKAASDDAKEITLSGDSTNCPISLDMIASAQATLDLSLVAPCRASERVVIRHGGLTVTGMTSLTGTLFTSIPGMEPAGEVFIYFNDGIEVSAAESLPDLPLYRRFAVQWVADDAFQLNAFESGASYGAPGHVSATNPARRLQNVPMQGGYLSLLGDLTASLPMLAEVYTFPLDPAQSVELTIEASVTEATCNRELLGEVLLSQGGIVTKTDLTMATPTCDAIGDVLVLNNPLPDLKLAAAN